MGNHYLRLYVGNTLAKPIALVGMGYSDDSRTVVDILVSEEIISSKSKHGIGKRRKY